MGIGDTIKDLFDKDDEPQEAAEDEAYSLEAIDYGPDEPVRDDVADQEYAAEEDRDLLDTVDSARGGLESLMGKIPGYKGYKEKEMRREADKLLRMQVADQLDDQRFAGFKVPACRFCGGTVKPDVVFFG